MNKKVLGVLLASVVAMGSMGVSVYALQRVYSCKRRVQSRIHPEGCSYLVRRRKNWY